jgi:hypothetical protein
MAAIGNEPPGDSGQGQETGSEFDYRQGYEHLRPEFTRATQELSEVRNSLSEYEQLFEAARSSDPEVQAQALEALGLELDTGSPAPTPAEVDEFVDPLEEELKTVRSELDELKTARELEASEAEQARLEALRDDYIGQSISEIEEGLKPSYGDNFKFTEKEEVAIGNLAIQLAGDNEVPDVKAAYELIYTDVLEANRERWISSKTGAAVPPAGTTIPTEQRPKTPREQAAFIDERLAEVERQRR